MVSTLTPSEKAEKYLKPYQGLKREQSADKCSGRSRKIPKTLSGIETWYLLCLYGGCLQAEKYLKPYQGLKPNIFLAISGHQSRKIPKTLSGIETHGAAAKESHKAKPAKKYLKPYQGLKRKKQQLREVTVIKKRRKIPKTLSGIETPQGGQVQQSAGAEKYLKPYQGLKLEALGVPAPMGSRKIPKTLSGIETIVLIFGKIGLFAEKYLKPYQGLKQVFLGYQ